jgi:hypothetical protein
MTQAIGYSEEMKKRIMNSKRKITILRSCATCTSCGRRRTRLIVIPGKVGMVAEFSAYMSANSLNT